MLIAAVLIVVGGILFSRYVGKQSYTPRRENTFKNLKEVVELAPERFEFREVLPLGKQAPVSAGHPDDLGSAFPGAFLAPTGSLSGRVFFLNAGHGLVYSNGPKAKPGWHTTRDLFNGIIEDYGNIDQMNMFASVCFNSGGVVVPFRPIGQQTNEIILDNVSSDVSFQGEWNDSNSDIYYGRKEAVPYKFAFVSNKETATAQFCPRVANAGLYPVYTWVRHGADRIRQLYRIFHAGGETLIRIPHNMVGNGWVYLGTYYLGSGQNLTNGAVVVSNLRSEGEAGTVVVADAIRFGNGMGSLVPRAADKEKPSVSGYPREEEAAKYWIQAGIGQGQPSSIYSGSSSDENDNVNAPARMAKQMNREGFGKIQERVYLSFHSNSGNERGVEALYNNATLFPDASTPNQERLAKTLGSELNTRLAKITNFATKWQDRGSKTAYARSDFAFGEINNKSIGNEFDAVILEVGYHDNLQDARLLREPLIRSAIADAAYRGILRFFSESDNVRLDAIPSSPFGVSAQASDGGKINIAWSFNGSETQPEKFIVYCSTDGNGFGSPMIADGRARAVTMSPPVSNKEYFFRVAALGPGGESFPSSVVGCKLGDSSDVKLLVINSYTKFDARLNVRQVCVGGVGSIANQGKTFERVIPQEINGLDNVKQFSVPLKLFKVAFDSCDGSAIRENRIQIDRYKGFIWNLGYECSVAEAMETPEGTALQAQLKNGNHLMISGASLETGPSNTVANGYFAVESLILKADEMAVAATKDSFLSVSDGSIRALFPALLRPVNTFSPAMADIKPLLMDSKQRNLAVTFSSPKQGKCVAFGFPIERLEGSTRNQWVQDVLGYFGFSPRNDRITQ